MKTSQRGKFATPVRKTCEVCKKRFTDFNGKAKKCFTCRRKRIYTLATQA